MYLGSTGSRCYSSWKWRILGKNPCTCWTKRPCVTGLNCFFHLVNYLYKQPRCIRGEGCIVQDFVWGRRLDVSSGRFSFHVRYFYTNIWYFFYFLFYSIPVWETLETAFLSVLFLKNFLGEGACPQIHRPPLGACSFGARMAPCGGKTNFTSGAFTTMSATLQSYWKLWLFLRSSKWNCRNEKYEIFLWTHQ